MPPAALARIEVPPELAYCIDGALPAAAGVVPTFASERSEHELIEAVRSALYVAGYAPLRHLEIEICGGIVVLWGRVPTYYQKQLAQVTAQRVAGVRGIANGLEVVCRPGNKVCNGFP